MSDQENPQEQNKPEDKSIEANIVVETDVNVIREHANESISHNLEVQAVDYLIENNSINLLPELESLEKQNIRRLCTYMIRISNFIADDAMKLSLLQTSYILYLNFGYYYESMVVALRLRDDDKISRTFTSCKDSLTKKQICNLLAKQKYYKIKDEEYISLLRNYNSSSIYLQVAEFLKSIPPKTPFDVYKNKPRNFDHDCFVNAFINAGFCKDAYFFLPPDVNQESVPKINDLGMIGSFEAAAGIGAVYMWNVYEGLNHLVPLLSSSDHATKLGAIFGVGICCSQVYNEEEDLPFHLLHSFFTPCPPNSASKEDKEIYFTTLLSIALAYMGTNRHDIVDLILPAFDIDDADIIMCAMLAISLIFVSNPEMEVIFPLLQAIGSLNPTQHDSLPGIMAALSLGLIFMNSTNQYEMLFLPIIKSLELPPLYNSFICIVVRALCYIGSGDLNIIQEFLHILSEHIKDEDKALAQKACLFGMAFICMNEPLSTKMVYRQLELLLTLSESPIKNLVPVIYGILSPSSLNQSLLDIILRRSASLDSSGPSEEAKPALFALGLLSAGSNSSKVAKHLRNLMATYLKRSFDVTNIKNTFGLLYMGKGLLSISPSHTDHQLISPTALACLLIPSFIYICKDKTKIYFESLFHYMLLGACRPSYVALLDKNDHLYNGLVRLGQAVDIVGVAGNPRPISGFETKEAPLLMDSEQRAILADNQGVESICEYLEDVCYIREVKIEEKPIKK